MANMDVNLEKNKSSTNVNEGSSSENSDILGDGKPNQKSGKKNRTKNKYAKNSEGFVSIYITSFEKGVTPTVNLNLLKEAIPNLNLQSTVTTEFGGIINFLTEAHAQKILKLDLAKIFGKPVQVVPLYSGHYRKIISFMDIPWCIRNEELEVCLKRQAIGHGKLTREKSTLYVELFDYPNYQKLREEGINFYDSVMFRATEDPGLNEEIHYNNDNIIQCYKCQGFWHTANSCKQNARCVRCGEEHQVESCNRPKNSPICCNCKGPHHAAYKLCPVRLKLKKSSLLSDANPTDFSVDLRNLDGFYGFADSTAKSTEFFNDLFFTEN